MIFANLFAITSAPQHIQDVKEMVLSLLEDEQLEVLFIVLYMKLTEIVTIQMKASEQRAFLLCCLLCCKRWF